MPAFLYFVEGHNTPVTPELLTAWGLDYAFDSSPWCAAMAGPGGVSGTLFCDATALEPMQPKFLPAEQTWRRIPRGAKAEGGRMKDEGKQKSSQPSALSPHPSIHLGYYTDARPTRDDLARDELVAGYQVELADGQAWQVPLVKQVTEAGAMEIALPTYVDFDEDGKPCFGRVVGLYAGLLEIVAPFWEAWYAGWSGAIDRVDALDKGATDDEHADASRFAIECESMIDDAICVLGHNYRVSKAEVAALELFRSDEGTIEVLKAACDIAYASMLLQKGLLQKKTAEFAT